MGRKETTQAQKKWEKKRLPQKTLSLSWNRTQW